MSAFLVADRTINGFVTSISTDHDIKPMAQRELSRLPKPYDLDRRSDVECLAHDCFRLNMRGVDEHYGSGESVKFRNLDFQPAIHRVSRVQAYKSLCCFLYQCHEEDVKSLPLFKALKNIMIHMSHAIVCDLSAYQSATWD